MFTVELYAKIRRAVMVDGFLHFSNRRPLRPYSCEHCQWPGVIEGEPDRRAGAILKHLVLGETGEGHDATGVNAQPPPSASQKASPHRHPVCSDGREC